MYINEYFNHDVYIGSEIVGYVNNHGVIYINSRRFAEIKDDGGIYLEGTYKGGEILENGDILLNNKCVGHITSNNDIYFSPKAL